MPTSLKVAAGVSVRADPDQVWELAMDWPRQREWIWATRTEGGQGTGAEVTARTAVGPVGFTDTMLITQWDPPRRCNVKHTGKVVRGSGIFEVIPSGQDDGMTEFRWTEYIDLPVPAPLSGLAGLVVGPLARAGLGWSLLRFGRLIQPRS